MSDDEELDLTLSTPRKLISLGRPKQSHPVEGPHFNDLPSDMKLAIINYFDCTEDFDNRHFIARFALVCNGIRELILKASKRCDERGPENRHNSRVKSGWIPLDPWSFFHRLYHREKDDDGQKEQYIIDIYDRYYMVPDKIEIDATSLSTVLKDNRLSIINCKRWGDRKEVKQAFRDNRKHQRQLDSEDEDSGEEIGSQDSPRSYDSDYDISDSESENDSDSEGGPRRLEIPYEDGIHFKVTRKLTPFIGEMIPVQKIFSDWSWSDVSEDEEEIKMNAHQSLTISKVTKREIKNSNKEVIKTTLFLRLDSVRQFSHDCWLHYTHDQETLLIRMPTMTGKILLLGYKLREGQLIPVGEDLLRIYYKVVQGDTVK